MRSPIRLPAVWRSMTNNEKGLSSATLLLFALLVWTWWDLAEARNRITHLATQTLLEMARQSCAKEIAKRFSVDPSTIKQPMRYHSTRYREHTGAFVIFLSIGERPPDGVPIDTECEYHSPLDAKVWP